MPEWHRNERWDYSSHLEVEQFEEPDSDFDTG